MNPLFDQSKHFVMRNDPTPSHTNRRRLKPPPNYNSRAVQLKLFVVVAACMGVLWLVVEAAKPDFWRGLFGEPTAAVPATDPADEVNTRLASLIGEEPLEAGTVRIMDPFQGRAADANAAALDPVARSRADGWSALYRQATSDERSLMAQAFKYADEQKTLSGSAAAAWNDWLTRMDQFWSGYISHAKQALENERSELKPDELSGWMQVLDQVGEAWQADRAALASLAQAPEPKSEAQAADQERLATLQHRWERMALAAIEDDTVHRPGESDAWFRLCDILNTTSSAELEKQPAEQVNYVQMFKQPEQYRGKLVRFKGRVMQAKRIAAVDNVYGIEHQYILWIQPDGGPKSPIVVYALGLPPGFPEVTDAKASGGYVKMREDVEVTGYFFKRWAYRAQDGINTAPLVLAKVPVWIPSADLSTRGDPLPTTWAFMSWVLVSALFGVVVAVVAYARSRIASRAVTSFQTSPAAQREREQSLDNPPAGPSVSEALQALEERDREVNKGPDGE